MRTGPTCCVYLAVAVFGWLGDPATGRTQPAHGPTGPMPEPMRDSRRDEAETLALAPLPGHLLVEIDWRAETRGDFSVLIGNAKYVIRDPARHAEAALQVAFARAARAPMPPWPLQVIVRSFDLANLGDGVQVRLGLSVLDRRDGWVLYKGTIESTTPLPKTAAAAPVVAALLTQALDTAADESMRAFAGRQRLPLVGGNRRPPMWLGVEALAPADLAGTLRLQMARRHAAELALNPGWPGLLVRFSHVYTLLRREGLSADAQSGLIASLPRLFANCAAGACDLTEQLFVGGEGRFGLGFWLGDDERHLVGLSAGLRVGVRLRAAGSGLDGTGVFALAYGYGF
ncbi:MAG: hypothetical protein EXR79_12090 [Myxococcales bacterium]|nr:hypothetical protein [Myxococcales bacterium]